MFYHAQIFKYTLAGNFSREGDIVKLETLKLTNHFWVW